ncbi:winged helix-turn-helix domain-containing protein [Gallaecimonas kandeliae]|uniref:winged helix-turn-helix domain-containing protein n=1 Tax=Gallaecimonas kandeliae TaxID=3029055 RepID=UPI0026476297|nr:winged helix-turn-helix domain-containing protein [Gallaecimonas kandeliae]WKE66877.1 winged helix-turn-helix domain-containing protein [Gallaecimonas kandeliae]
MEIESSPRLELDKTAFRIGEWLVRPELNLISQGDQEITLEPRAMAILTLLARHAGEVVSRDQLLDHAWNDVIVSDNALNQFIVKLRRALGDDARSPRFIVTVPKKGYRLVAEVQDVVLEAPRLPPSLVPKARPKRRFKELGWGLALVLLLLSPLLGKLFRELAINQRFTQKLALTALPGQESQPQFSPDSHYIAFTYSENDGPHQLYLQKLPPPNTRSVNQPRSLTDDGADRRSPAWSPDGRSLAFVWRHQHRCEIRVATLDLDKAELEDEHRVAGCLEENSKTMVRFGKDNQTLYFNHRDSPEKPYQVYRLRLATGQAVPLTNPIDPGAGDVAFALSHDGSQLAVVRDSRWQDQTLLFVDATHGYHLLAIYITGSLHRNSFSWGEDAGHYYLIEKPGRLERMDSNLLSQTIVTDSPLHSPVYDPVNDQLLVVQGESEQDIYRTPNPFFYPGAKAKAVANSDADEYAPSFGPDGKTLYFASRRTGKSQYWRMTGPLQLQLTDFDEDNHLGPLHFNQEVAVAGGNEDLLQFDTQASRWSETHLLSDYRGANPRWSSDGKHLYFASERSGDWQIWRWDNGNSKPVQVTRSGGYCGQPDKAEKYLYLTRVHTPGLWRMELATGQLTEVGTNITWQRCDGWQLAGSGIYYLTDRGEQHIHRYDLGSGSISEVLQLPQGYQAQFDVSPDEAQLLYTLPKKHPSELLLLRR